MQERLLYIYPSSCMVKRASSKYKVSRTVVTDASRSCGHELAISIRILTKKWMVGFVTTTSEVAHIDFSAEANHFKRTTMIAPIFSFLRVFEWMLIIKRVPTSPQQHSFFNPWKRNWKMISIKWEQYWSDHQSNSLFCSHFDKFFKILSPAFEAIFWSFPHFVHF